jgi:hypothetical protein
LPMTRKDSEKDSERPHYYSQFWLDVAAGRRIIGAPRPNEEAESDIEPEPEPVALRRPPRASSSTLSDGYSETLSHPEVGPEDEIEDLVEPELDDLDLDDEVDESELPPTDLDESEIPDVDFAAPDIEDEEALSAEEEEEFFPDDEEEEEEDEEVGWSGRGRKKPRPGRQQKTPKKAAKRDTRRGF